MTDERENRLLSWIQTLIIERNEARKRCARLSHRLEQLEADRERDEQQRKEA